jgi:nucleoid-associated protein YgaU
MSLLRLAVTSGAMAAVAVLLRWLTPDLGWVRIGGLDLQATVDTAGPEALLLAAVAVLAWAAWGWGVLGLALTALSALPGLTGRLARAAAGRLLPAGARRAAALALGVGLAAAGPLAPLPGPLAVPAIALAGDAGPAPEWPDPDASAAPVPEWPDPDASARPVPERPGADDGEHVVVRGDCLWRIAAADLLRRTGTEPSDAAVASAVSAWWTANAAVIGPDPDLLLPGQVLRPPPS